ncbi:hypothetical protein HPB50_029226 [Hyalomma asiaticum]|nr:hypothetical protein HPB50_029226 [Hyalomma asiaticum]
MSVRVWGERTRVLGLPRVASATQEMLHPVEGTVAGPPVRRAGAFECGPGDAEVRGVRSGDRTGVAGLPREASATQNGRVRRDWANRRSGAPGLCRVGCVASCGRYTLLMTLYYHAYIYAAGLGNPNGETEPMQLKVCARTTVRPRRRTIEGVRSGDRTPKRRVRRDWANLRTGAPELSGSATREKVRKGRPDERGGAPEGGPVETQTCCVRKDLQSNDYLVDPASNHMLVSKIKPCMSKYMPK